ncbi:2,3-bisphosphoglycerate-dependent phosphoglycerate mutase [Psychrobacillus sp. OK028]|uniref:histidine phosphatase family protein n=1 Tax=Psychrobacillus sp. OK028 TaxID=1884359 RepID=UPI00088E1B37|nr:histidine phosphatase family protein [Psychrobacillus sp. OK028]SDN47966.1 2,3-bisphosphoglycerate-dependent phosphoglycerate mutase [Psychrobacillus sp. OK028]
MKEKKIYLIRHCQAKGQEPSAGLTNVGREKALELVPILEKFNIDHIISSPYKRAVQTIKPFSESKRIPIIIDDNLQERVLSADSMEDWLEKLERTFLERDLTFSGGESSIQALTRIREVVDEVFENQQMRNVAIVSHGNILSLLINHYETTFGFAQWQQMKNPDIFVLEKVNDIIHIKRIGQ